MLDFVADLLTTVLTTLFPIFASYKALRSLPPDPSALSPWLMYWVVIALLQIVESHLHFILSNVPFYAWLRLFVHIYLVLPGQQGATHIYTTYIHPWLAQHEQEIENFIAEAHEKARQAGMGYLKQALAWIRVNVLRQDPAPPTPPRSSSQSYAQQLLSRFNMPASSAPSANDFYGLLSSALAGVSSAVGTGTATQAQAARDLSASGTLIPKELEGKNDEEKMKYLSATRESLRVLLQAYDKEAFSLEKGAAHAVGQGKALPKVKSELDFARIDKDEDVVKGGAAEGQTTPGGGWMPWSWGAQPKTPGDEKKLQ